MPWTAVLGREDRPVIASATLGMYGVAGHYLGSADHLPIVRAFGEDETWVALVAWGLTFVAMCLHLLRTLVLPPGAVSRDLADGG